MGKIAKLVANFVIISVISIFLYDIFNYTEHWPFSSHRMYSTLITPTYVKYEVFMLTPEGEVPMDVGVHLEPFGKARLVYTLRNLLRLQDRRVIEDVLASLARVYERNKAKHGDDWPEMIGLKAYHLQWQLDPELKNLDHPQKTPLFGLRLP